MEDDVIACSLEPGKLKDRLEWIATLNARSLKASCREGLTLTLDYEPAAIEAVRKFVAGEQSCCAFLDFKVTEGPELVSVSIAAPESARFAAEALFERFTSRAARGVVQRCGCKSERGA